MEKEKNNNTINIPILPNYAGSYRIEYDGKYISLFGKDKNFKCIFSNYFEEMILIPVVLEIRNASPEIKEITDSCIIISLI